jgi:mannobiose 2-epimerase
MTSAEKIIELQRFAKEQLFEVILPFWTENMVDDKHGGFLGRIDMNHKKHYTATKGIVLNARILWSFSALFGKTGDKKYLDIAQRALDYIEKKFKDPKHGGYFWELNADGSVSNPRKQVYAQAFVIYAYTEYSRQTGDEEIATRAIELFRLLEEKAFDKENDGYFEAFSREWGEIEDLRLSKLDMNEKKTMNTHLHVIEAYANLFHLKKERWVRSKIEDLLNIFNNIILEGSKEHLQLFFDEYWNLRSSLISYGHDIEASWLLRESASTIEDDELIWRFSDICVIIANSAMQSIGREGGLIHEYDPLKKGNVEYEWWAQAEGIVGFMEAYRISGEEKFLDTALGISKFIEDYFIDQKYGEWYYRVDRNGNPIKGYEKAGFWKCPYHSMRMCMIMMDGV